MRTIGYQGTAALEQDLPALKASLRQSVRRDMRIWTLKARTKEVGGKPYKWHGKKLTFGKEEETVTELEDGAWRVVISVPMEVT